jgi:hypothetical protein
VDVAGREGLWFEVRCPVAWSLDFLAEALVKDLLLAGKALEGRPKRSAASARKKAASRSLDDPAATAAAAANPWVGSDHFTHLVFPDGRWFTNDFALDASSGNHAVHLGDRASATTVQGLGLKAGETFSVEYERGMPAEATATVTALQDAGAASAAAAAPPAERQARSAREERARRRATTGHGMRIVRQGKRPSWWQKLLFSPFGSFGLGVSKRGSQGNSAGASVAKAAATAKAAAKRKAGSKRKSQRVAPYRSDLDDSTPPPSTRASLDNACAISTGPYASAVDARADYHALILFAPGRASVSSFREHDEASPPASPTVAASMPVAASQKRPEGDPESGDDDGDGSL